MRGVDDMIIRKKLSNGKRSASAWIGYDCIYFGVTDHDPSLGRVEDDENGNVTITINKSRCENANVKIKIVEDW